MNDSYSNNQRYSSQNMHGLEARIFRSSRAFYYQEELEDIDKEYSEHNLEKMAEHGFNGIWLHGILRNLVKVDVFPEFGKKSEKYLKNLRQLVDRAAKYKIKVYFYFTEPLGFSQDSMFFKKYTHLKGEPALNSLQIGLCSSMPEVKEYLEKGMYYLFSNAPGLGGVILVTANEHMSHCYTSLDRISCPRCSKREKTDVIAEIISLITKGIKSAAPEAKVIVWNWSWRCFQPEIIAKLPQNTIVMADFERGGHRIANGIEHLVDEYSFIYTGPSERFLATINQARQRGLKVYAKLQIGVTHEIATVPYFPALFKLAEKLIRLRKEKIDGSMLCWNFGCELTRNTELVRHYLLDETLPDSEELLLAIAKRDFGDQAAPAFVKAWKIFSDACNYFPPFDNKYLYWSPTNFAGAYPLFMEKLNCHMPIPWLLPDKKYNAYKHFTEKYSKFGDEIQNYCGTFGADITITGLHKFCSHWKKGLDWQKKYFKLVPPKLKKSAEKEIAVCTAIYSQMISTANITEFFNEREKLFKTNDCCIKNKLISKLQLIAKDEIGNSLLLKECIRKDNRLGFHGEAFGYFYTPEKIDKKIEITKKTIKQLSILLSRQLSA